jgi:transmembrane sensor
MDKINPKIAEFIVRQLRQQSLTADEQLKLQEWIDHSDQNRADYQQLRDPVKLNEWVQEYRDLHSSIWSKVDAGMRAAATEDAEDNIHTLTIKRRRINRYIAAAAILLAFLFSYAWLASLFNAPSKARPVSAPVVVQDVAPGGDKATLTLGNGSTLALDSTIDGQLAEQGMAHISKEKNLLTYTAVTGNKSASTVSLYNTLTTSRSGQFNIVLPDGTKVWLNNASSLRYPTSFSDASREVELIGEGYFEVSKNKQLPFHLKVNDMHIEVLGTHFNIMAYEDEPVKLATLLTGSIKVSRHNSDVLLKPGEQAQVDTRDKNSGNNSSSKQISIVKNVDLDGSIAWKNGYFHFNRDNLQTVMRQLARWYDVDIAYEGDIPHREFDGDIQKRLPLSQLLEKLGKNGIHFKRDGRKIIVMP